MATPSAASRSGGQKTMERILIAAEEVFVRFGFEGARMDQIAERAGVRKANIYYYFDSKEDLYRILIDRILTDVIAEVRTFLETSPTVRERWALLDTFLDLLFQLVDRYHGLIGLAFGELLHPPREKHGGSMIWPSLSQVETIGKQMIADGIAEGTFRDEDPGQLLLSLEGAIFYYFLLPQERLLEHTKNAKFTRTGLEERKQHLSWLIRRILER